MLKILQARLQQYMDWELPDVQAEFRKGRETREQIANICWIIRMQENSRKTFASASLTMLKPLTMWITTNCGKFLKRWKCQTTLPASCETCMQVKATFRNEHGTTDCFQIGKGVCQGCILSPCICRVHHVKCWARWSISWNQDCQEKYQQPQICRYHSNGRKWTKEPLDES